MMLYVRMMIYAGSALLAGQGLAIYDADAGTITFDLEHVGVVATGGLTFLATFVSSRFSKAR